MGCNQSTAVRTNSSNGKRPPPAKRQRSHGSEAVEESELSDYDLLQIREEIRIRQEMENQIGNQIAKEKEALRAIASLMIEQRSSCESLLDELNDNELDEIRQGDNPFQLQKLHRVRIMKNHPNKKKKWMISHNKDAIEDRDLEVLTAFFKRVAAKVNGSVRLSGALGIPVESAKTDSEKLRELLALNVMTITPQTAFYITQENMHDFDLPPGMVTQGVASLVIELYKRGGHLSAKSVHKLLRLGYKSMKQLPNINYIDIGAYDRLTIVGDIHGQLPDLLHIIDCSGLPSATNKYIFNGDFVDRGSHGVEVMCTLLALQIAMPQQVVLNRGNHEDYAVCAAYGFQMECIEKYGELIFGMFIEVFSHIPLFAVINKSIFVLHGGLFHSTTVTLEELNTIKRTEFSLEDMPEGGEGLEPIPRFRRKDFLKQLVRDALWSDPVDNPGVHPSIRGAGIGFGPDITEKFLTTNKLNFVVRSHECVRSGYNEPFSGSAQNKLCTIFSASDYGGAGNSAAFIVFRLSESSSAPTPMGRSKSGKLVPREVVSSTDMYEEHELNDKVSETKTVQGTDICYGVHYYYINKDEQGEGGGGGGAHYISNTASAESVSSKILSSKISNMLEFEGSIYFRSQNILSGLSISLHELLLERKAQLHEAFLIFDDRKDGRVSPLQWSVVMHEIMRLPLAWMPLLPLFVPEKDIIVVRPSETKSVAHVTTTLNDATSSPELPQLFVDYNKFLTSLLEISLLPVPKKAIVQTAADDAFTRYLQSVSGAGNNAATAAPANTPVSTPAASDVVRAPRSSSDSSINLKKVTSLQPPNGLQPLTLSKDDSANKPNRARCTSESADATVNAATAESTGNGDPAPVPDYFNYRISKELLNVLYVSYAAVERIYTLFDTQRRGYFTKQEFLSGCRQLNETLLPAAEQWSEQTLDLVFRLMDYGEIEEIDMNQFYEFYRLCLLLQQSALDEVEKGGSLGEPTPFGEHGGSRVTSVHYSSAHSSSSFAETNQSLAIKGRPITIDEISKQQSTVTQEDVGVIIDV